LGGDLDGWRATHLSPLHAALAPRRSRLFRHWRLEKDQSALTIIERERVACVLRHFIGVRYELFAYVVMNGHVHVLVEPAARVALESIVHSWKSYSGRNTHDRQRSSPICSASTSIGLFEMRASFALGWHTSSTIHNGGGQESATILGCGVGKV
jgi:REP element-mobilizing transposase RayT